MFFPKLDKIQIEQKMQLNFFQFFLGHSVFTTIDFGILNCIMVGSIAQFDIKIKNP